MQIICLDIGNTSGHFGLVRDGIVLERCDVPTSQLGDPDCGLRQVLRRWPETEGLAYSSVVPTATSAVEQVLQDLNPAFRVYPLRWDTLPDLGFDYPNPKEVGGDRVANTYGAKVRFGAPAVVICMGTATVFDILTDKGYAGGIIGPGLALMADYLHEKTALLPKLDRFDLDTALAWGKSTKETMKIGCGRGYKGMILSLLEEVLADMRRLNIGEPTVILTGGNASLFNETLYPGIIKEPDLAVQGLYAAYLRSGTQW